MQPWWKTWPERLDFELKALRHAGIKYSVRTQDEITGVLDLDLEYPGNDAPLKLQARLSAFFPYTRFEVFAQELNQGRHQNPFLRNLCLIGRSSAAWNVSDTVAGLIAEQLPKLLNAANEPDHTKVIGLEEQQGEPLTAYLPYAENSLVLVDGSWKLDSRIREGELVLGIESASRCSLRGAVLEVRDLSGTVIAGAPAALRARYGDRRLTASWFRTETAIREQAAKEFLRQLATIKPASGTVKWTEVLGLRLQVVGVVFPDEIGWRERGDSWAFVVRTQFDREGWRPGKHWGAYFARPANASPTDLGLRAPQLVGLANCSVAVVGLGCIGAPSTMELARGGIRELRLMDDDVVEPATTPRWPLGFSAAGKVKAVALCEFIAQNYPYTHASPWPAKFGGVTGLGGIGLDVAEKFLNGMDLIYDATAEEGVHYLLAEIARERKMPYVCASATPGGWGGRVVRIVPGQTGGCWSCLLHHIDNGTIPEPPADPDGDLHLAGCADPTFTGAGFDLLQVPTTAVRVAATTLLRGQDGGYPDFDFDVGVLRMRNDTGKPMPPVWTTYQIARHPACANH